MFSGLGIACITRFDSVRKSVSLSARGIDPSSSKTILVHLFPTPLNVVHRPLIRQHIGSYTMRHEHSIDSLSLNSCIHMRT